MNLGMDGVSCSLLYLAARGCLHTCKGLLVALGNKWYRPCLQDVIKSWLLQPGCAHVLMNREHYLYMVSCDIHARVSDDMNRAVATRAIGGCVSLLGLQIVGSKNRVWCSPRVMNTTLPVCCAILKRDS